MGHVAFIFVVTVLLGLLCGLAGCGESSFTQFRHQQASNRCADIADTYTGKEARSKAYNQCMDREMGW